MLTTGDMKFFCATSVCLVLGLLSACTLNLPDPIEEDVSRFLPTIKYAGHIIYSDSSKGNAVNSGEVALQVWLRNTGLSDANLVKAAFSTDNSYVSNFYPQTQIKFGTILKETTKMVNYNGYRDKRNLYTIRFTVNPSIPEEMQVPVYVEIEGRNDKIWRDTFYVAVR